MASTYHCPSSLIVDFAITGVGLVPTRPQLSIVPIINLYNHHICHYVILHRITLIQKRDK